MVQHESQEYDGAEVTSDRSEETGEWHFTLKKPSGETTEIRWHTKTGAVEVKGPHGERTVAPFSDFATPEAYKEAAHEALMPYEQDIALVALAHENLVEPELASPNVSPEALREEMRFLEEEERQKLEQRLEQQDSAKESGRSIFKPSSYAEPARRVEPKKETLSASTASSEEPAECLPGVAALVSQEYCGVLVGYGSSASSTRACLVATDDLRFVCSNQYCLGCKIYYGCSCNCASGDFFCYCLSYGEPCCSRGDFGF